MIYRLFSQLARGAASQATTSRLNESNIDNGTRVPLTVSRLFEEVLKMKFCTLKEGFRQFKVKHSLQANNRPQVRPECVMLARGNALTRSDS